MKLYSRLLILTLLVAAALVHASDTLSASSDASGGDASDYATQPHQLDVNVDIPTLLEDLPDPQIDPASAQTSSPDAADPAGSQADTDKDPLPWEQFFREMVDEPAKPAAKDSEGKLSGFLADGDSEDSNMKESLLDPGSSLASRLVGAFRGRREKEDLFEDYIDEEIARDRMVHRLDGMLGNTAMIIVTEAFEAAEPARREDLALRWANKWKEIIGAPIARTTLYSLRAGELIEYSFYSDQPVIASADPSPLAMLSQSPDVGGLSDDTSANEQSGDDVLGSPGDEVYISEAPQSDLADSASLLLEQDAPPTPADGGAIGDSGSPGIAIPLSRDRDPSVTREDPGHVPSGDDTSGLSDLSDLVTEGGPDPVRRPGAAQ